MADDDAESQVSFNLSEGAHPGQEMQQAQRELMNMGLSMANEPEQERKIESKDSMWKPAPIIGRDLMNGAIQTKTMGHPSYN